MRIYHVLPDISLLFVAIVWGASYSVAKDTLTLSTITALIFFRFAIAFVVLLPVCIRELKKIQKVDFIRSVILGGILSSIFYAETVGVLYTTATNAAFLISLCLLFTPVLDSVLNGKSPSLIILGCVALSLIGVAFLVGGITNFNLNSGDLAILCAACLRAIVIVSTKKLFKDSNMSSTVLTFIQFGVVTLFSGLVLFWTEGHAGFSPTSEPKFWAGLLFLSLFCTLAAFFIQNWAIRRTNPTRVSFLMGTEPIFGALFAFLLLSENLGLYEIFGITLILTGTCLGTRHSKE